MWTEIFPNEIIDFSADTCPKLIGVMRIPSKDDRISLQPLYKCDSLLVGEHLTRTTESVTSANLVTQLVVYKQQFEEYDKQIVSIYYRLIYIFIIKFILAI